MDILDIMIAKKLAGGGSAVSSVNGKTGAVELTASDIGAVNADYVNQQIAAAIADVDDLLGSGAIN